MLIAQKVGVFPTLIVIAMGCCNALIGLGSVAALGYVGSIFFNDPSTPDNMLLGLISVLASLIMLLVCLACCALAGLGTYMMCTSGENNKSSFNPC